MDALPTRATSRVAMRRNRLRRELIALGAVGVMLAGAVFGGGVALYRTLYSPAAFVQEYLADLAAGRAADALGLPGVAIAPEALEAAGLPPTASDALLRSAALGTLSDVRVTDLGAADGITTVRADYRVGGHPGSSTFEVAHEGWIGVAPTWRFAKSPLAAISLEVLGSTQFTVNGFALDKRQLTAADADLGAAIPMLVFSPGLYAISVQTAAATAPGVAVLSDVPTKSVPVRMQTTPTQAFVDTVSQSVSEFLTNCATQQVLQPSGCPFGFIIRNRIDDLPQWSIVSQPAIELEPDGNAWRIVPADAVAHIEVPVRLLSDGSLRQVSEDVPFSITGTVSVEPDGAATIVVSAPQG